MREVERKGEVKRKVDVKMKGKVRKGKEEVERKKISS